LQAATTIRSIVGTDEGLQRYVLVVEHDLAILDYLSGISCGRTSDLMYWILLISVVSLNIADDIAYMEIP
jgi:hypothetical protein